MKKAVILYFPIQKMETTEVRMLEFHDKMKLKTAYKELGARAVPPAVAHYGAYISKGVIMMPSYVNIHPGNNSKTCQTYFLGEFFLSVCSLVYHKT